MALLRLPPQGVVKPLDAALSPGDSAYPELWRDLAVALPILAGRDPHNYAGRVICSLENGASVAMTDVGRAVALDGTGAYQHIRVPEPFPQTDDEWTWATWFDYRGTGGAGVSNLVQSEDGDGTGRGILFVNDGSSPFVLGTFIVGSAILASTPLIVGRRYMAAITKRGTTFSLYLGGKLDGSGTGTATPNANAAIRIGAGKSGVGGALNGRILAVYAWHRAVSEAEMRLLGALPVAPFVRRRRTLVAVATDLGGPSAVALGVPFDSSEGQDFAPGILPGTAPIAVAIPFAGPDGADHAPAIGVAPVALGIPFAPADGTDLAPSVQAGVAAGTIAVPFAPAAGADYPPALAVPDVVAVPFAPEEGADPAPTVRATMVAIAVPLSAAEGADFSPALQRGALTILIPFSPSEGLAFAPGVVVSNGPIPPIRVLLSVSARTGRLTVVARSPLLTVEDA